MLGSPGLTYTPEVTVFSGFLARAQGLHEGSVAAIGADNPYGAFTLLRSYAENAAAMLYLKDHPSALRRFLGVANTYPVPIGKITNYADNRFGGFRPICAQLSEYAHPASLSLLASHRDTDHRSDPVEIGSGEFKSEDDARTACG